MAQTTVTFFLAEQMLATSLTLPLEQMRAAESMQKAASLKHFRTLKVNLASIDGKAVTTSTGIKLQPDCAIADIEHSDLTYLPALWRSPIRSLTANMAISPWLNKQHVQGGIIAGVGTGCCFMAESGLLDFRVATTHWYFFEQFSKRYPKVYLERNHFITAQDNLYCAASVNSLADLTVFFIQELFGGYYARQVERHFFHEVRKAYNITRTKDHEPLAHPDEEIARAQSWLQHNFDQEILIKKLAQDLKMSLRNFNRRFKKATNETPIKYLHNIRMKAAGDLLKTSNLTIAEIAERSGYQDIPHFTSLFKKHFGTTPSQYRTTVRAKLFTPE